MSNTEHTQVVSKFFALQVDKYILRDLERMNDLKLEGAERIGGCAIPMTMTIFAAMEMFGTYMESDPLEQNGRIYLENYLVKFTTINIRKDFGSLFNNFRNGHMHIFFAKTQPTKMYGVTKEPNFPELVHRSGDLRVLNVPLFYSIFLQSVANLKKELFVAENHQLLNNFYLNITKYKGGSTTSTFTTFPQ
jgi:hypothetical protein